MGKFKFPESLSESEFSKQAKAFIKKAIVVEPGKRATAEKLLKDSWIANQTNIAIE